MGKFNNLNVKFIPGSNINLNFRFISLSEAGIKKREIKRWTTSKPECRKDSLSAQSLNLQEILFEIEILLLAFIISGIIMIVETRF